MNHDDVVARLTAVLTGRAEADVALARLTTYRVGGPARIYVEPADPDDLARLAGELAQPPLADLAVLVLGRGSNVVVSDHGFDGIVVRLSGAFSSIGTADAGDVIVGAAMPQPQVSNWAARRGLAGLEFLVAIPGSIGGAVRMNAGAHGAEIRDRLVAARIVSLATGDLVERPAADLDLAYRRSNIGPRDVVVDARFALDPAPPEEIKARTEAYRRHRAETQPGAVQNAGSVFKNPSGDHAGRLVDAAGLKGFRVGGARVSDIHANFFIAEKGAHAQDVYDLVHAVRARVRARFDVDLEPEISFVGPFDPPPSEIEVTTG